MRLDHIAYRVSDREKTAQFFVKCLGYRIAEDLPDGFQIEFDDNTKAQCYVLIPPEELDMKTPWSHIEMFANKSSQEYHKPPEIFVSEGTAGSIVEEWVNNRDGVGGIHHLAYQVDSVADTMKEWQEKGYAEFTTKQPLTCPGLSECFTKPSALTGIIYEFIERETVGFCKDNVKDLMNSTKGI
jgi:catechol 2,3-dioxygenase-like lactoylglutathione lyase family enzyme